MGYNHTVAGWDKLEGMINALELLEINCEVTQLPVAYYVGSYDDEPRHCRMIRFVHPKTGKPMCAEEYMASRDSDSDGTSFIGVSYYEEGKRPKELAQAG